MLVRAGRGLAACDAVWPSLTHPAPALLVSMSIGFGYRGRVTALSIFGMNSGPELRAHVTDSPYPASANELNACGPTGMSLPPGPKSGGGLVACNRTGTHLVLIGNDSRAATICDLELFIGGEGRAMDMG